MEFNGAETRILVGRFSISDAEVELAQMGFESIGSKKLRSRVEREPGFGIADDERARMVVAGNIALINSLSVVKSSESILRAIADATETVNTGLDALDQAHQTGLISTE